LQKRPSLLPFLPRGAAFGSRKSGRFFFPWCRGLRPLNSSFIVFRSPPSSLPSIERSFYSPFFSTVTFCREAIFPKKRGDCFPPPPPPKARADAYPLQLFSFFRFHTLPPPSPAFLPAGNFSFFSVVRDHGDFSPLRAADFFSSYKYGPIPSFLRDQGASLS